MDSTLSEQSCKIHAIDRALQIPSVNYLWDKSTEVYGRVKGVNTFTNWAFDTIEMMLTAVITKSLPVARLMEKPIYNLDKTLCHGIDFVEIKLPIIKEDPKQVGIELMHLINVSMSGIIHCLSRSFKQLLSI